MAFNHLLSAILRGPWLIDQGYVSAHLPLIQGLITGKVSGAEFLKGNAEYEQPFALANGRKTPAYTNVYNRELGQIVSVFNESLFEDNSLFVIPTIGPVTKYNGDCGETGMTSRAGWLNDFSNSAKLSALVSFIDSPGGQADGTPQYVEALKNVSKPKKAFVDGGAYSAGAWIASGHDEIILSGDFSGFGSIGAYTTIADFTGYYKKQGIKVQTIYPDESSEKNLEYREAIAGNTDLIKADIRELALFFRSSFAENRSGKLKNDSWNKGKVFNGKEALDLGLVDRIGTFDSVAASLGVSSKMPSKKTISIPNAQTQSTDMKFPKVFSLAGKAEPTETELTEANAELAEAGITGVALMPESVVTEAASVTTQLNDATANVTKLTGELATANEAKTKVEGELATANSTIKTLQDKVEAFGKNAGGKHEQSTGEDTPPAAAEDDDLETILANMPHNKKADSL